MPTEMSAKEAGDGFRFEIQQSFLLARRPLRIKTGPRCLDQFIKPPDRNFAMGGR